MPIRSTIYIIASDVYVMTSHYEGISVTTIEAIACKIPVILCDVPGLREFSTNGCNSILIPEDFEILAKEIVRFFLKQNSTTEMTISAELMLKKIMIFICKIL